MRGFVLHLLQPVALAASLAYAGSPTAMECDPRFVSARGPVITVAPTNDLVVGDTANLQCALDAATASGRHTTIRLSPGTFRTAQLVAKGFVGSIQGGGMGATVLTNVATPLPVTPVDFYLAEPGPENPWPTLVSFLGGEFRVADLTIRISGEAPTTGWSIFGFEPPSTSLAHAIAILGARANARFSGLEIEGGPGSDPNIGLNLDNGIFFAGFLGSNDLAPIAGRFDVHGCLVRQVASPAPVLNLRDADVTIVGNRFLASNLGGEVLDLENVRYVFSGNQVDSSEAGVSLGDGCLGGSSVCGFQASNVTVAANALRAFDGVEVFATFAPDMKCTVVANEIDYDAENGGFAVVLGRRTRGCFVVTEGAVLDRGTDNRVVILP